MFVHLFHQYTHLSGGYASHSEPRSQGCWAELGGTLVERYFALSFAGKCSCSRWGDLIVVEHFGPGCLASALGSLYSVGFGKRFPEGIIPPAQNNIQAIQNDGGVLQHVGGGIQNLQQGLYWTGGESLAAGLTNPSAAQGFTHNFTTNDQGRNTTRFNYFHVVPIVRGAVGTPPTGTGLIPYANNALLYDSDANITWSLDAQLAASQSFGVTGTTTIPTHHGAQQLTLPNITPDGVMGFQTAHEWVRAMNHSNYAGSNQWSLPTVEEMQTLYAHLHLDAGFGALLANHRADPFRNVQRFFYWSCQTDSSDPSRCSDTGPGPAPGGNAEMQWAFNFQSGFLGTAKEDKRFFVMVYYRPSH